MRLKTQPHTRSRARQSWPLAWVGEFAYDADAVGKMPIPLRRLLTLGAGCCQAILGSAVWAASEISAGEITWQAPPGCGTSADLRQEVIRLLGDDASGLEGKGFWASVVEEQGGRWHLTLKGATHQGTWSRTLSGAGCRELRDAAKVMIALAIEPSRAAILTPPDNASAKSQPLEEASTSKHARDSAPTRARATATGQPKRAASTVPVDTETGATGSVATVVTPDNQNPSSRKGASVLQTVPNDLLWFTMQGGVSTHVLPKPSPFVTLGALLRKRELALAGSLGWMAHQTAYRDDSSGAGARAGLVFAAAKLGYVWVHSALELETHAGLIAGAMLANSFGVAGGRSNYGPFGSVNMGVTLTYPAQSPLCLELSADGLVSFLSPDFRAEGIGRLYQPGLLGAFVAGGLRIRLK